MEITEILFEKALKLGSPWRVEKVEFMEKEERLNVHIDFPRGSVFPCPRCGKESKGYDTGRKEWRHLNFFQYECYLMVRIPRIECEEDGVLQIEIPWAREGADLTFLFESLAMSLCREMPVNKVSKIIGVDDNKLWRMLRYYVEEARKSEDYSGVSKVGMDETSMRKGHNYITIVADLDKKRTIFVGEGKDSEVMEEFKSDLEKHGGKSENISNLTIDMSPAFISGAKEYFPDAEITFDKFHVIKILNKAVDKVRKVEANEQEILKATKYIWLKNRCNLTEHQKTTLEAIESMPKLNLKTVRAMHIRENFQYIYLETEQEEFEAALKRWYFWATHSRILPIKEAAKTIKKHWDGIISWFKSRLSNGLLEGLNSLIQSAKSKARGYKTHTNFTTIIYLITGKLDFSKLGLTHLM